MQPRRAAPAIKVAGISTTVGRPRDQAGRIISKVGRSRPSTANVATRQYRLANTVNASGLQPASTASSGSGGNFHYGPAESQHVVQGLRRDGGGGCSCGGMRP